MNYEEFLKRVSQIRYVTGVTVYWNKKYKTFAVSLHRNRRETIRVMDCKNFNECIEKIKEGGVLDEK